MPSPYPLAGPVVSGSLITVDAFLNNPTRVTRAIDELTNRRFITDVIFAAGPRVDGGAVVYDQVLAAETSFLTRDAQAIEPGSEFPILNDAEVTPLVAPVAKYGGEVMLTYEAVRRDRRDLLAREMVRLRNTIVRKVDAVAIAALEAAPILTYASADWGTAATDILSEIASAAFLSTSLDMGYEPDTILVNPAQVLDIRKDADIRSALTNAGDTSMIRSGIVGQLAGFTLVPSSRVAAGTAYLLQRQTAGSVSDEVPLYARPLNDERRETWFLHGGRVTVPYITDPKAVVRLTGI